MLDILVAVLWVTSVIFGIRYLVRSRGTRGYASTVVHHLGMQVGGLLAPVLMWGDDVLGSSAKELVIVALVLAAAVLLVVARLLRPEAVSTI